VTIVGAAVVRDGRVLAAQRAAPPQLAGRWEFPGGKLEPGETEAAGLVRECREELGVDVEVGSRLGADIWVTTEAVLRVWLARLPGGEPQAYEHLALRWLAPDELDDVDWLAADRPLVAALRPVLEAVRR
jgi:8-oxo-dGTP diphosphatase